MARQYDAGTADTVRTFAKIAGGAVVLLGILGLLLGDEPLFGLINIDLMEDIVHLITGGLLLFVGFQSNNDMARSVVGGIGVLYLLVGILGFIDPTLFGMLEHGYTMADNILHLVIGAASAYVGFGMRR